MNAVHILWLLAVIGLTSVAAGQIASTKLEVGNIDGDQFGSSVSIGGNFAVVGASGDDDLGPSAGAAYLFQYDGTTWVRDAKLTASDGSTADFFGTSVSVSGDYALVGARSDDDNGTNSGSAYVFKREGNDWIEVAKLLASDGSAFDIFGGSVSLFGDYALVGAVGSAYIYKRDGFDWIETKLTGSDCGCFGYSVSISGDYAVVGAHEDHDLGSVYIYRREGVDWVEDARLAASDGEVGESFGYSVSVSGTYVIVGAYKDDDKDHESGSAYIFRREGTGWVEEAKLLAYDGTLGDFFGMSVSISGDRAVVGAFRDNENGPSSGSAYVYERDGTNWVLQEKLLANDETNDDLFGGSVSFSGDDVIVGSNFTMHGEGPDEGFAWIFSGFSITPPITVAVSVSPDSGTGSFDYDVDLANTTDSTLTVDIWTEMFIPGRSQANSSVKVGKTLNAGQSHFESGSHSLDARIPDGDYVFKVSVGEYPDVVMTSRLTPYTKISVDKPGNGSPPPQSDPSGFILFQNHPNPFNPVTNFEFSVARTSLVSLKIYDLLGRDVATVVQETMPPGTYRAAWNATTHSSGIYLGRLSTPDMVRTVRLLLIH